MKLEISIHNYDTQEGFDNKIIADTTIEFKMPSNEKEFDKIADQIKNEGLYYRILKDDGSIYCTGILTIDSLYDDLIIAPRYMKEMNKNVQSMR